MVDAAKFAALVADIKVLVEPMESHIQSMIRDPGDACPHETQTEGQSGRAREKGRARNGEHDRETESKKERKGREHIRSTSAIPVW